MAFPVNSYFKIDTRQKKTIETDVGDERGRAENGDEWTGGGDE